MNAKKIESVLMDSYISKELKSIADKVYNQERVTFDEGVLLYEKGELGFLGSLANFIREKKHRDHVYFNRNFHIEPTNICVFDCKFCSYSRLLKQKEGAWELSEEDILKLVRN